MQLDSQKHLKNKEVGGLGGGESVCHCLLPVAWLRGIHPNQVITLRDFILSSTGLREACQHFCWLLGILNIPPEP